VAGLVSSASHYLSYWRPSPGERLVARVQRNEHF